MTFWESFAATVESVNTAINNVVWGIPMLVLIIGTGILMTALTKVFQITKIKEWCSQTFLAIFKKKDVRKADDKNVISQFQALTTALAATIGTGNIAGVATAIVVGGPGAIFWMWVSAFFGMMTNFSENVLGIYYRKKNEKGEWSGGAMYYLQEGLKDKGKVLNALSKPLAVIFAIFCVLASFGIGNMTQINSIASSMQASFRIPPVVTGVVLAVVAGLVIVGGIKRIGQVTEKLVPFMAVLYIIGTVVILIVNIDQFTNVFGSIFSGAFGLHAIAGGTIGSLIKNAMTMGFKRGVFSNEAGLGSSVMVHSASNVKEPVIQGMWGIFEVFFDTFIVCTLTAFAIISTGVFDVNTYAVTAFDAAGVALEGPALVGAAFSHGFGSFAGQFVSIAILLFAFSTVLGWSFYGTKAMEYLGGAKAAMVYKVIFVLFIVVGATMNLQLAWDISDTLNGLMAIPNLIGVVVLSMTVRKITNNYIDRNLKGKDVAPILSAYDDIQAEVEAALAAE